jgi:hypothetical protein
MSALLQEQQRQRQIDKLNRETQFDPEYQFYPADLFVLVGFDPRGQPIKERNPHWHDENGFYVGIGRRSA